MFFCFVFWGILICKGLIFFCCFFFFLSPLANLGICYRFFCVWIWKFVIERTEGKAKIWEEWGMAWSLSFDLLKGKVRFLIKCERQFGNFIQSPTVGFLNTHGLLEKAPHSSIKRMRILFTWAKLNFFCKVAF